MTHPIFRAGPYPFWRARGRDHATAACREVHPTTGRGSRPGILTCDDQRSAVARHDDLRAATPLLPDLSTGFLADLWVPEKPRPGEPAVDTPVAGCGVDQRDRACCTEEAVRS